ncbi:hypothetical protein [Anaerosalibacter sp. Marseille-P3206]|uniref:hypothetical protein n=1 Tax=Anaerosalibacter sp. Marseille-P3206 TaxID=1871005 RepID=UPI0009875149|nr:hypothetical protein [Anaerosalibacter sp. Marseille-P3206]
MSNTILLIIGIIFIIISIININKTKIQEEKRYEEIVKIYEEAIEYRDYLNEITDNLESIIDSTIYKVNKTKSKNEPVVVESLNSANDLFKIDNKNEDKELIEQVLELREIGLTTREIAQKLNKGIREIDIMLKVNENMNRVK